MGDTGTAQALIGKSLRIIEFKRQTTTGAVRLADEGHLLPAIETQRPRLFNQVAAIQTLRRHQHIQCPIAQLLKGSQETGVYLMSGLCHKISMSESMTIFNRRAVQLHRNRAAATFDDHDFLFAEIGERLCDRLEDVTRSFPVALDLGCHTGGLRRQLQGRGNIETLIQADLSESMARQAGELALAADEEFLPFAPASFDLVLSNLSLHWVNDLPGALLQIRQSLKPGGLFLATMLGGETLRELRQSMARGETAIDGGLSPHVSPFADVRDGGNLLQRAGFIQPVADLETLTVSYPDPFKLMADLRGMGESNAVRENRKGLTSRRLMMEMAERYREDFADGDERFPATFQTITLTAWVSD